MTISFKRIAENILLSTLLICFLSFSACKANVDQTEKLEDESHYATVYISLNTPALENNNSISSARTATPVLPSAITYSLSATGTLAGTTTSKTVSSDNSAQSDPDFSSAKKYMLKLPAGTWTVTVTGKNSNSQTILSGTSEQFEVAADGKYEKTVSVLFITDSNGKGRINLEIETTGTNIGYVKISGSGQTYLDKQFNAETEGSRKVIKLYNSESNNIASGNYNTTLTFYNSDGSIATIIREMLNIRNNMPTDTWYKSGSALYLKNKTGSTDGKADFILTQEILDSMENSTFYVAATGSDTNDGTRLAPYATLSAAWKRVNNLNNVNYDAHEADSSGHQRKSFTIICDGVTGNTSTEIIFAPEHNLDLTIEKKSDSTQTVTLKASEFRFHGTQSNDITIKNISLTGNVELKNGNLIMDSVPTTGILAYYGGQLTIGGTTSFSSGISLNAATKKILLDSAITSSATTSISAGSTESGTSLVSSYTTNSVIIEGAGSDTVAGSYKDVTSSDLSKFTWGTQGHSLVLQTLDGKAKAVLD